MLARTDNTNLEETVHSVICKSDKLPVCKLSEYLLLLNIDMYNSYYAKPGVLLADIVSVVYEITKSRFAHSGYR